MVGGRGRWGWGGTLIDSRGWWVRPTLMWKRRMQNAVLSEAQDIFEAQDVIKNGVEARGIIFQSMRPG